MDRRTLKELLDALYGNPQEEKYSCFIEKYTNHHYIPQNYPRHSKLGEFHSENKPLT